MIPGERPEPARALASAAWIGALAALVVNDRLLKGAGIVPAAITGKASDFAGVFVAGVLLAVLVRARGPRRVAIAQIAVGAGFSAFKLVPALSDTADAIYGVVGLTWRVVADPTDLIALPMLALAHVHVVRALARPTPAPRTPRARFAPTGRAVLAVVGLLACIGSQQPVTTQPLPCGGTDIDCDGDGFTAPEDCNDADPTIRPSDCPDPKGEDTCDDGQDNDFDGLVDCRDDDCDFACADLDSACLSSRTMHDFGAEASLDGSTLVGTSVTDGSCVGADAPEVIFQGEASREGILTIGIPEGHGVYVREACRDAYTEVACAAAETLGGTLQVPVVANELLTIVVEAIDPLAAGEFHAPIELHPTGCGDGVRANEEACDDGNWVTGDGCDGQCHVELDTVCAAATPAVVGANDGDFALPYAGFGGACAGTADTREHMFSFVATGASVDLEAQSAADVSLWVRRGACPGLREGGCIEASAAGEAETLTIATTPGEALTIAVELRAGQPEDATFTLTVTEPPAMTP